jgi:hypothetical protein
VVQNSSGCIAAVQHVRETLTSLESLKKPAKSLARRYGTFEKALKSLQEVKSSKEPRMTPMARIRRVPGEFSQELIRVIRAIRGSKLVSLRWWQCNSVIPNSELRIPN